MKTAVVRSLNLLLIAFLINSARDTMPAFFVAVAIAFIFIQRHVKAILQFLSLSIFVLTPRYQVDYSRLHTDNFLNRFLPENRLLFIDPTIAGVLLRAIAAVFFLLIVRVLWNRLYKPVEAMAVTLALIAAGVLVYPMLASASAWAGFFLLVCCAILIKTFIAVIYFRQVNFNEELSLRDTIWTVPYWQLDIPHWESRIPENQAPLVSSTEQLRILRNVAILWCAFLLFRGLEWLLFSPSGFALERFGDLDFQLVALRQRPIWLGWVNIFFSPWSFSFLFFGSLRTRSSTSSIPSDILCPRRSIAPGGRIPSQTRCRGP